MSILTAVLIGLAGVALAFAVISFCALGATRHTTFLITKARGHRPRGLPKQAEPVGLPAHVWN